jgi:hypothetical protein
MQIIFSKVSMSFESIGGGELVQVQTVSVERWWKPGKNLIKQKTQPKGKGKEEQRERTQVRVRRATTQSESQRGKQTKVVKIGNWSSKRLQHTFVEQGRTLKCACFLEVYDVAPKFEQLTQQTFKHTFNAEWIFKKKFI